MSLTLSLFTGLAGCSTAPQIEANKPYSDTGKVVSRIGDNMCKILVATDHYGVYETETLDYVECTQFWPGMPVIVEIYNDRIRIIGHATH